MKWIQNSPRYSKWVGEMLTKLEYKSYQSSVGKALNKAGYERTGTTGRHVRWILPKDIPLEDLEGDDEDQESEGGDDDDAEENESEAGSGKEDAGGADDNDRDGEDVDDPNKIVKKNVDQEDLDGEGAEDEEDNKSMED